MTHNLVSLDRYRLEGKSLPRVQLRENLEPENVLDGLENGIVYKAGWKGSVIGDEGKGNHKGFLPVLFDDYQYPVWIDKKYLEVI